jgi:hypothetical protein
VTNDAAKKKTSILGQNGVAHADLPSIDLATVPPPCRPPRTTVGPTQPHLVPGRSGVAGKRTSKYLFDEILDHHCIHKTHPQISSVLEKLFFMYFRRKSLMSNNPQSGTNDAPKTPAPGTSAPAPQQNQGDKPAPKPGEQQK